MTMTALTLEARGQGSPGYSRLWFRSGDMSTFDRAQLPMHCAGNVFFEKTKPCKFEEEPLRAEGDPTVELIEKDGGVELILDLPKGWAGDRKRPVVTMELLGQTAISKLAFDTPEGGPVRIDTDYFGKSRGAAPMPGPFEALGAGRAVLKPR